MRWPIDVLILSVGLTASAAAQVGHNPARSPYRSLRYGQFVGATGGWFGGSGGSLGVAPHGGAFGGLRYDFLANGSVSLALATTLADLKRIVIDPTQPIENAASGPVPQRTFLGEAIVQFNVTGGKTWNRLAPFVSAGFGLVLAARTPEDQSGFKFRTKFAFTPGVGTRVYLGERLFLRLEARNAFWQVTYPSSYREVPAADPTKPPVLAAPIKEWLANGWYTVGLSYAFSRPF